MAVGGIKALLFATVFFGFISTERNASHCDLRAEIHIYAYFSYNPPM